MKNPVLKVNLLIRAETALARIRTHRAANRILQVLDLCQSDKGFEIFLLHYAGGVSREAPPGTVTTMGVGTAPGSTAMRRKSS